MAAWKLTSEEWDAVDEFGFGRAGCSEFRNALIILAEQVQENRSR